MTVSNQLHADAMRRAIELSLTHMRENRGGPFGAVVTLNGDIIAEGWNRVTSANDPTAHAEIVAIRQAASRLGRFSLAGCSLYTSCEPCPMCLAAAYWARVDNVYFANSRADAAEIGFDDGMIYEEIALPIERRRLKLTQLLQDEAAAVFREWAAKPDKTRY